MWLRHIVCGQDIAAGGVGHNPRQPAFGVGLFLRAVECRDLYHTKDICYLLSQLCCTHLCCIMSAASSSILMCVHPLGGDWCYLMIRKA